LSLTGIGETLALKVHCPSGTRDILRSGSKHRVGGALSCLLKFALGAVFKPAGRNTLQGRPLNDFTEGGGDLRGAQMKHGVMGAAD
jgi:hypothetical protein